MAQLYFSLVSGLTEEVFKCIPHLSLLSAAEEDEQ